MEEAPVVPTDEAGGQEEAVNNEVIETEESAPPVEDEGGEPTPENEQETEVETDEDVPDTHENKGIRKRIDKLNTKVGEAEQRAIDAEFELARLRKDREAVTNNTDPTAVIARPQEGEFETYEAYEDAILDWRIDSKESERNAHNQQAAIKRQQEDNARSFDRRAEQVKQAHPDFDQIAKSPAMLDFYDANPRIRDLVESSEVGPDIAIHFGKNRDAAINIASMPRDQAAKEIGKLEIKLSTTPKPKAVSKAPTPINPIKGGGEFIDNKDDPHGDKLSTKEWMKREDAKRAKK